jgi:hypothetical protein
MATIEQEVDLTMPVDTEEEKPTIDESKKLKTVSMYIPSEFEMNQMLIDPYSVLHHLPIIE